MADNEQASSTIIDLPSRRFQRLNPSFVEVAFVACQDNTHLAHFFLQIFITWVHAFPNPSVRWHQRYRPAILASPSL